MMKDLRFALRLLVRDRTFTVTALLTLAVCIAANVAVFSIVYSVVLSPLPFPESDDIVLIHNSYPGAGAARSQSAVPDYYDRLAHLSEILEEQALYQNTTITLGDQSSPRRLRGLNVTPSFFRLLRVSPQKGRFFLEAESGPGEERKVIISNGLWQQLFGGADTAISQTLRLNGISHEIIGVTSPDFLFIDPDLQIFRPLAFSEEDKSDDQRHSNNYENIARLRPGATIEQARAKLAALIEINNERFPHLKPLLVNAGYDVKATTLKADVVGDVENNLYLLWAGVICVLLIGAVNVANLSLARTHSRSKEMATRVAVGATTWRLTRQLVTESLLLGFAGGVLGLLLGNAFLSLITSGGLAELPRGSEIGIDSSVVLASLGLVLFLALFLGLLPLFQAMRINLSQVFREDTRTGTSGRGTLLLRNGLVVAQIALAFLLLVGAGLLLASFRAVLAIDPGFEVSRPITTFRVNLPETRYPDPPSVGNFTRRLLERTRVIPGVDQVGATSMIPFGTNTSDSVILAEGYEMKPGESLISPYRIIATDGYFETLGIPLVEGRTFNETDVEDGLASIIIDQRLARKFWPEESALGHRLYYPTDNRDLLGVNENTRFFTVVGVVRDVRQRNLLDAAESVGACYFPYRQMPSWGMTFAIRSAGVAPPPIDSFRRVAQELDPELPVYDVFTMQQRVSSSLNTRRTPMFLSFAFGVVALFLAAVGIYGVVAYLVTQRTREIGIRIALGSDRPGVFYLILRQGIFVLAAGLLLGGVGFGLLGGFLSGSIYGVSAFEPLVMTGVAILLGLVTVSACLGPARRATRIDPVRALNIS